MTRISSFADVAATGKHFFSVLSASVGAPLCVHAKTGYMIHFSGCTCSIVQKTILRLGASGLNHSTTSGWYPKCGMWYD